MTSTLPDERRTLISDVRSDHAQLVNSQARYDGRGDTTTVTSTTAALLKDLVTNVGFQQLAVFRVASALYRRRLTPLAMAVSRCIRHIYAAEMHWAATIAPGVVIVHGNGLVISREAQVGSGCILFQNVTMALTRGGPDGAVGAPRLLEDVHVGPGSALLGPITIGPDVKIAANSLLTQSVGAGMTVMPAEPRITQRRQVIAAT